MRAKDLQLASCQTCGLLQHLSIDANSGRCPRCRSQVQHRKYRSVTTSAALLLAAILMYLPANLLPIMVVSSFGSNQADTILSGVVYLLLHDSWPLALIIFVASIIIPLLKMITLSYLIFSVHNRSQLRKRQRTKLYRLTELVGRWSMVDVFVVALMAALVQLGELATITPGVGASAFAAVVVLTMFAAMAFDPRLIWDA